MTRNYFMTNEIYVTRLKFKLRDAADCASQHTPRTSENPNSTFLLTETLGYLQFQGVLKSRYIAGQGLNMCGRVAF